MMIDKKKIKYGVGIIGLSAVMATSGIALQGCKKNENKVGNVIETSDEDIIKDNINGLTENKESGMKEAPGFYEETYGIDFENLTEEEKLLLLRNKLKETFSTLCVIPEVVTNELGEQGLKIPKDYLYYYVGEEQPCGFWSVDVLEDGSKIVYPANGVLSDGTEKVYTVDNYIAIPKEVCFTEEQLVKYSVIRDVLKEVYDEQKEDIYVKQR